MLLQIDRCVDISSEDSSKKVKLVVDYLDGVYGAFATENGYKLKLKEDDRMVTLEKIDGEIVSNQVYLEGSKISQAWLLNDNGKTLRQLV